MLTLRINGESRALELEAGASLQQVIEGLGLKADRVAVERNGDIAPRTAWALTAVSEGDRLEIVHFVGGGSGEIWADRAKRGE